MLQSASSRHGEAAFLRERLVIFGRIGAGLSVVFYAVVVALGGAAWWTSAQGLGILIVAGALATLAFLGPKRGLEGLHRQEAGVVLAAAGGCAVHGWLGDGGGAVGFDALLALGQILVVRAVLIPSSWRRTAVLGALAALPVVLPAAGSDRLTGGLFLGWGVVAVAVSTLVSHVVHDLRRRIDDAKRLGRYVLEGKIGEGGMGEVYRARHAMLRRPTAIKLLRPEQAGEEAIARFEQEVQRTAQLTHPNTVAVYDYGRSAEGVFYYAMELLPGVDLQRLVEHWGPVDPARAAHILVQVCGSLQEAHEAGLIHRDVKAANVLLTRRGGRDDVAKVVDFGLVHALGEGSKGEFRGVVGTPAYLSPEGFSDADAVDARSDLYAVGVLGWFLLAGRLPFEAGTLPALCHQHLFTPPPPLPEGLPPALVETVMACLAKQPEERPASAAEVAARLADLAAGWSPDRAAAWWAGMKPVGPAPTYDGSDTVDLT